MVGIRSKRLRPDSQGEDTEEEEGDGSTNKAKRKTMEKGRTGELAHKIEDTWLTREQGAQLRQQDPAYPTPRAPLKPCRSFRKTAPINKPRLGKRRLVAPQKLSGSGRKLTLKTLEDLLDVSVQTTPWPGVTR